MENMIQDLVAALKLIDVISNNNAYDKQDVTDGSLINMNELRDILSVMLESQDPHFKNESFEIVMLKEDEELRTLVVKINSIGKIFFFKFESIELNDILNLAIEEENYEMASFLRDATSGEFTLHTISEMVTEESKELF